VEWVTIPFGHQTDKTAGYESVEVVSEHKLKLFVHSPPLNVNVTKSQHLFHSKIYAPSSSLLQGKHLPFSSSPLRLNIFRLFVRWLFLSNLSEGGQVCIFKCGSRKEKYLGSVTISSYCLISLVTKWDCDLFHSFPLHFNIKLFGAQMVLQQWNESQSHLSTKLIKLFDTKV
jgi:hypothetical protein